MRTTYETAGGTVCGTEHARAGRNNQDAWQVRAGADALVAVVADGCSSGAASEVGAALGAAFVADAVQRLLPAYEPALARGLSPEPMLETVRRLVLAELTPLAQALGADRRTAALQYLLFTVVGTLVTNEVAAVFALGDGLYAVNGRVQRIGPFPDNAPPYLAYGLFPDRLPAGTPEGPRFQVLFHDRPEEVQNLLIGTDGVTDLAANAEAALPGTAEPLGPLAQFWEQDLYFHNADAVRRRLARANRERLGCQRARGLLPDDTTLVALRRQQGGA